ncbi:MAG: hypothetical protein RBS73_09260 [Prolixibacteraceae bacterium]|jgi:hypothetical protein|nr:hypothetical protein [Prolixibacteraceae bacterium]
MNKYLTAKNIENADLIAVSQRCPFEEVTRDCPFIPYHRLNDLDEQIRQLNTLDEDTLQQLRSFHRSCIVVRRSQMELNEANFKES